MDYFIRLMAITSDACVNNIHIKMKIQFHRGQIVSYEFMKTYDLHGNVTKTYNV